MQLPRVKSALEYGTNIALVLVCCLLVWLFVRNPALMRGNQKHSVERDLAGASLSPISPYKWNTHDKTLVLALQVGCRFCQASMPFYKRLSGLQQANRLHTYLLAVMPDENASARAELRSNGIDIPCACGHPLSDIHVWETPTLLLVNAQGRVERAWVGQLPLSRENDVIAELEK